MNHQLAKQDDNIHNKLKFELQMLGKRVQLQKIFYNIENLIPIKSIIRSNTSCFVCPRFKMFIQNGLSTYECCNPVAQLSARYFLQTIGQK